MSGWGSISAAYAVGVLGNNGILFSEESDEGCAVHPAVQSKPRASRWCSLQNITGFMVGTQATSRVASSSDGAKLINAVSNSTVPHLNADGRSASYGAGQLRHGRSSAYDPRFVFTWPNHRIAVMGSEAAGGGAGPSWPGR